MTNAMENVKKFNVRVYGICFNERQEILVTDEIVKGREITKFPGGGLEFGEGTIDCIKREFVEETEQEVEVVKHFYTTDLFVTSAFHSDQQVISIYYLVKFISEPKFEIKQKRFDFHERKDDVFVFRWLPFEKIKEEEFTFEIDKKVALLIRQAF